MNNTTVGIITFHCSYNYGSVLQAYALQEYISGLGFNVFVINYKDVRDFSQYELFRISSYKKSPKSLISDIVFLGKHIKRKNSFEQFICNNLRLTEKVYTDVQKMTDLNDYIDIFVCGSDQIWNLDCTDGINPAFFLSFAREDKIKIAYAPSLAHSSFRNDYREELKEYLDRIDYISVREPSTVDYIESIIQRIIPSVVDPTLLVDEEIYDKVLLPINTDEHFVFAYMISYNEEMVAYCNSFSREKGLKLYYVTPSCLNKMDGINEYGASPGQFLSYIKNADYVITNSFHAVVFSVVFHKQFVTFSSGQSYSRITDLLNSLSIKERTNYDNMEKEIDYITVADKLVSIVKQSKAYINSALGVK